MNKARSLKSFKHFSEQGFTLLEMLVALMVFSLAALSLIRLQGVTIRTASDLDTKVIGQIVARNLMTEWVTDPVLPGLGKAQGEADNGGRRWRWVREAKMLDDRRMMRIDVTVDAPGGGSPAVLTFLRTVE